MDGRSLLGEVCHAVIPIAGRGSRMSPVSWLVPKEFLPLGRKTAVQHIADEMLAVGIEYLTFVVSPGKESVHRIFGESVSPMPQCQINTVIQDAPLGLGHAIQCAQSVIDNHPFIVALGDCLIGLPGQCALVPAMKALGQHSDAQAVIAFERVDPQQVHQFGIAQTRASGDTFVVQRLVEKPSPNEAPSNLAICGRYLFGPEVFPAIAHTQPGFGGEIQLTDAINQMIADGAKVMGITLPSAVKRYDLGEFGSYVQSFVEYALADPELEPAVRSALDLVGDTPP